VAATAHGRPSPKNTFTELDPVIFPIASSAYFSPAAADIDAKVSGKEVPKATKVMAVTDGLIPSTHPKTVAKFSTIAVVIPINPRDIIKQGNPP
jgi:hypothetical protein